MNKKMYAIVLVALLGSGVAVWKTKAKGNDKNQTPQETVKVARGSIHQFVASTGRIVANLDVDIKCKASGEVTKLPFDVSDSVKKGELLLELDPIDEKRVLTKAEVSLSASQARLAIARENLNVSERNLETNKRRAQSNITSAQSRSRDANAKSDRIKQLFAKNLASQEEVDTTLTAAIEAQTALENAQIKLDELKTEEVGLETSRQNVRLAEAQVEMDKIALNIAQDRLLDTKVQSPMDGVVTVRNIQTGQIISSGISNVGGGTTVLTVSDLSRIFVLASVDESEIGKILVGQKATVTADAFSGKSFEAVVERIASKGISTSNVVTFEVKLELLGKDRYLLKPEMTANIEISTALKENVLVVPVDAILREKGTHVITVLKSDGMTEKRTVEPGITDNTKTEIVSGLSEGETVLIYAGEAQSRWNSNSRPGMLMPPMRRR